MLIEYKADIIIIIIIIIISSKYNLFSPWYSWQIAHWTLSNNQSITPLRDANFWSLCNRFGVCVTLVKCIFKAIESSGSSITASVSAGSCEQSQTPTVATSTGGVLSIAVVGMSMYRHYACFKINFNVYYLTY